MHDKEKLNTREEIWKDLSRGEINQIFFCRKNDMCQPWFLRHEKIFHARTRKYPLVAVEDPQNHKRARSAKKHNRYQSYNSIEVDKIKLGTKRPRITRKQMSIIDKIGRTSGKTPNSKFSESTTCTITKINACV